MTFQTHLSLVNRLCLGRQRYDTYAAYLANVIERHCRIGKIVLKEREGARD